jgi:hypothetical protein
VYSINSNPSVPIGLSIIDLSSRIISFEAPILQREDEQKSANCASLSRVY